MPIAVPNNYIQVAQDMLRDLIRVEEDLLDLYTLLVFSKGVDCTREDVHDAWSVWKNSWGECTHKSLIPFSDLTPEIQQLDAEYTAAIQHVAQILKNNKK